jgi:hypothetical protein
MYVVSRAIAKFTRFGRSQNMDVSRTPPIMIHRRGIYLRVIVLAPNSAGSDLGL